jgi:diacylglycerol kinase family enzyme
MNTKKSIIFIINPISGTQEKDVIPKLIEEHLDKTLFHHQEVFTEYAGHAAELAQHYANEGIDIVVAVGGDGTVNEVARALVHRETALAIIPCGSGNGLARHLCLPMSMKGSMRILNECCIRAFDYGVVNDQPFFCTSFQAPMTL